MVTSSTKASHRVTQSIYATITDNYAHNSMPKRYNRLTIRLPSKMLTKYTVIPGFSRINKSLRFPGFAEL